MSLIYFIVILVGTNSARLGLFSLFFAVTNESHYCFCYCEIKNAMVKHLKKVRYMIEFLNFNFKVTKRISNFSIFDRESLFK